jgi:hypothetical protein
MVFSHDGPNGRPFFATVSRANSVTFGRAEFTFLFGDLVFEFPDFALEGLSSFIELALDLGEGVVVEKHIVLSFSSGIRAPCADLVVH